LKCVENKFVALFKELAAIQRSIHDKLLRHADGKTLKGNELVGWLIFPQVISSPLI